jgi:hypothetical protein
MSVAQPQKEGIAAIKLGDESWAAHNGQMGPPPSSNVFADNWNDNYHPADFTGGTQPEQVNRVIPAPKMGPQEAGIGSSREKMAKRTVTGANILP